MHSQDLIERLIQNELKGLCINCSLANHCPYRKATDKIIIQCELHQFSEEADAPQPVSTQKGLCVNCCRANVCQLPGRKTGIWHCEEYV
jgi:hypothetical protein